MCFHYITYIISKNINIVTAGPTGNKAGTGDQNANAAASIKPIDPADSKKEIPATAPSSSSIAREPQITVEISKYPLIQMEMVL